MTYRLSALIATTIFLSSQQLAIAGSSIDSQIISGNSLSFMLPINESIKIIPITGCGTKTVIVEPTVAPIDSTQPVREQKSGSVIAPPVIPETADRQPGPIIIDNDALEDALVETSTCKEETDAQGKTHIQAGAQFPVSICSEINSKSAKVGDPIQARLRVDLKIAGALIAPKGALVMGHVSSVEPARRMLMAELSMKNRWMRANGAVGIQFDEIITAAGEHIPLLAIPATQPRIVKNMAEGRVLGINRNGEVTAPLSMQLKAQAIHMAIRAGASAGGVFSFGAVPVAFGMLGALNPSFAFMHPVGKNVPHRRLKGFAIGFTSGLPGGFLITDTIIRGQEATIKPGDLFLAEFKQDFTGEQTMEAQLLPGVTTRVHGQVVPVEKKAK